MSAMHPKDAAVIVAFAKGDKTRRDEAIAIHRRYIPTLGVRGSPEMCFMAEVDNAMPDNQLRAMYREDLIHPKKAPTP